MRCGVQVPEDQGIPLEMLPLGDFEPQYRAQLDVQSGELPVRAQGWTACSHGSSVRLIKERL